MKNAIKKFWDSEDGMGVVEVVLITIVLVGLVVVFKKQITSLVNSILSFFKCISRLLFKKTP